MPLFSRAKAIAMSQKPGIQGMFEQIELAARTCYKSEKNIEYDEDGNSLTARAMVEKLMRVQKHTSVGEHGAVYLYVRTEKHTRPCGDWIVGRYAHNPYSFVTRIESDTHEHFYISTNYRVIVENGWEADLKYWLEPTEHHIKRRTVRIFTDRGVSAESNRHRVQSPSERSTRYVNYGKENATRVLVSEEFTDQDVAVCMGEWGDSHLALQNMCTAIGRGDEDMFGIIDTWLFANLASEWAYLRLIKLGWKPQQARRVLPLDTETELCISAYEPQWERYFGMRYYGCTGTPHPDMKHICGLIMDQFNEQEWTEPLNGAFEKYANPPKIIAK